MLPQLSRKALFLFLLLLPLRASFAQSNEVDSLKSALKLAKTDSAKLSILNQLAGTLSETDIKEAESLLFEIGGKISNFRNTEIECNYLFNKGLISYQKGNYRDAIARYLHAATIAEKLKLNELYFIIMNNVANVHARSENFDKSLEIQKRLIPKAKKLSTERLVTILTNIGANYSFLNNSDSAIVYFNRAYQLTERNDFYRGAIAVNLAFLNNNLGHYNKALSYAKEAVHTAQKFSKIRFLAESLTNVSNAYYGLKKYEKAIEVSDQVKDLAEKNSLKLQLSNAYGNLALAYEGMKNYPKALDYQKKYAALRDSLLNEDITRQVNELQIKYETEKKDHMLAMKDLSLRAKNKQLFFISLISFIIIVFSGVVFILYRHRNMAYKELVRKNIELLRSEDQIIQVEKKYAEQEKKYGSSHLTDEKRMDLKNRLENLIREEKIFMKADLTLGKLANMLNVNSKYLSQIIHEEYHYGFNDFINNLRIKEAAKLLIDSAYANISIEGISGMVGFNSKSSFNVSFRKFMGVTPSFYCSASKSFETP